MTTEKPHVTSPDLSGLPLEEQIQVLQQHVARQGQAIAQLQQHVHQVEQRLAQLMHEFQEFVIEYRED